MGLRGQSTSPHVCGPVDTTARVPDRLAACSSHGHSHPRDGESRAAHHDSGEDEAVGHDSTTHGAPSGLQPLHHLHPATLRSERMSDDHRDEPALPPSVSQQPATTTMPSHSDRPRARTRRLRRKHARMAELREPLMLQREQLLEENQDLSLRLAYVVESQAEMMNAFEAQLHQPLSAENLEYMRSVWNTVKSDAATYHARLERVYQLTSLLVDPEAQYVVAEEEFVEAAEKIVSAPVQAKASSPNQISQVESSRPAERTTSPSQTPPLMAELKFREAELAMYRERLMELFTEQSEDRLSREALFDRGDTPSLRETDFMQNYYSNLQQIQQDMAKAQEDVAALRARCLAYGYDLESSIQPHTTDHSNDAAKNGQADESTEIQLSDHHEHDTSFEDRGAFGRSRDSVQLWSGASQAGSLIDAHEQQGHNLLIDEWLAVTQSEGICPQRRLSTSDIVPFTQPLPDESGNKNTILQRPRSMI